MVTAQTINEDIDRLFGDTSVPKQTTLDLLEEIGSNIDGKIEVLRDEIRREGDK